MQTWDFARERPALDEELETYYAAWPHDLQPLLAEWLAVERSQPGWSHYQRKAAGIAFFAERLPITVFRHSPFFFVIDTGRARDDLGGGGITQWMKSTPASRALTEDAAAWWRPCEASGLSTGWLVVDDNHHALDYETLLRDGIVGTLRRVAARRQAWGRSPEQAEFLDAMAVSLRALLTLAERFAGEADRLAAVEDAAAVRARLRLIAATARRVPAAPPATFYEALCTLLFMREAVQWLDASGISVLGHLDRLLAPFYDADLAAGRLTREEAAYWLSHYLVLSDLRFGMRTVHGNHMGTNGTVIIGGCNRQGAPFFHEVTRLVVEIMTQRHLVDPKLNARLGAAHPNAFVALLAGAIASGTNTLAVFNDDVVIPAVIRQGKAPEDARLYVGGGCQENVLDGTEVNNRATIYLNLAQVLLMGLQPAHYAFFAEREGFVIAPYREAATFDELYAAFLANLRAVSAAHARQRNRTEAQGVQFNPCPLHSAFIADCIDRAEDMMAGGARYHNDSVGLTGIGTVIDSLLAIDHLVYREGRLTLEDLAAVLARDFADDDLLRAYCINRLPHFGHDHPEAHAFSARVFHDVAVASSGMPNARGGVYEPSLFSFRLFTHQGQRTGATPDGRRAGEELSPGMSPSRLALGPQCELPQVLDALAPLDLTDYPVVAVLDLKLPPLPPTGRTEILAALLRRFLQVGGSVLQVNYLQQAELIDARRHPERHRDLVVRVSGYSSYFTVLTDAIQDEVIARTEARG